MPDPAAIAWRVRRFLEEIWPDWHREYGRAVPAIPSSGTCGRSSLFLQRVLAAEGVACVVQQGEFHAPAKAPARHAWVEAGPVLLDVTADQFGLAPVVMLDRNDIRYRPGPDTALPAFKDGRARAVEAAWPRWLARA